MLLKEVKNFAKSSISRRKYLLSYFGEKYDSTIYNDQEMDDNSKNPKEKINAIEKLNFMVSNFFKSDQKISFKELINSLPLEENVISRNFWKTLITHCVVDGIFIRDINDIGSLKITNYGREYLNKFDKYDISVDNDFSIEDIVNHNNLKTGVIDTNLMNKLILLRKDIAKKSSLPPYAILQEFSLEDMTYKYPTSLEEFKNINGVGEGKVTKFGNYFIKLIKEYVEENQIQKPEDLILRTSGEKSSKKLSLIQNIDKKIPLDEISESRGIDFDEILSELESIVFSGTKLDIDYYIDEILDEDQQEELKEYFLESESEDILEALEEFDGDYDEEELRLYRIKFLNDVSN